MYMCAVHFWNKENGHCLLEQELGNWRRLNFPVRTFWILYHVFDILIPKYKWFLKNQNRWKTQANWLEKKIKALEVLLFFSEKSSEMKLVNT